MKRLRSLRMMILIFACKLIFAFGVLFAAQASGAVLADIGSPVHYQITDLGTLGGNNSWTLSKDWENHLYGPVPAPAINDNAEIIGFSQTRTGDIVPFLWKKGQMRPLNPPTSWHVDLSLLKLGSPYRLLYINSQGHILGSAVQIRSPSDISNFCFLTDGIKYRRLGSSVQVDYTLLYDNLSYENALDVETTKAKSVHRTGKYLSSKSIASAINGGMNLGDFVDRQSIRGYEMLGSTKRWPAVAAAKGYQEVRGYQVNGEGKLIGVNFYYATANGKRLSKQQYIQASRHYPTLRHSIGFVWRVGRMSLLPSLSHYTLCMPMSINEAGDIVGIVGDDHQTKSLAVLWRQGYVYDLNTLIPADSDWIVRDTAGINNRGQIVVTGYSKTKRVPTGETEGGVPIKAPETHVLLLTQIP